MKKIHLTLLVVIAFAGLAHADTTPLAFTGYYANNNGNAQTIGYEFSPTTAISVTALSYFDVGSDGLSSLHNVGLWTAAGALLASTSIVPATIDPIQDGFRYVTLSSAVTLTPGAMYFVGGTSGGTGGMDSYAQQATGVTFGQGITYVAAVYGSDTGVGNPLTFPNNIDYFGSGYGFYGGSFLYTVPEPSVWVCLLIGGAAWLWMRRFRRPSER